jgi:hypothetical protein
VGVTNARFLHARAAVGVRELLNDGVRGDVIVLDPPRTGAAGSDRQRGVLGSLGVVMTSEGNRSW